MDRHDKLVTLIRTEDEIEATLIAQSLEESGIKATTTGAFTAGFRAEAPGYVNVIVSAKDLAKATKLLESIQRTSDPVDWSQIDVGQPEE